MVRSGCEPGGPATIGAAIICRRAAAAGLTGPEGVAVRKAAQAAIDLKQTELNAQGTELNQRYESSAVIPDVSAQPEKWRRDRSLYNQATSRPGAKIPHAWLVDRDGLPVSTLDVTGKGLSTVVSGLGHF